MTYAKKSAFFQKPLFLGKAQLNGHWRLKVDLLDSLGLRVAQLFLPCSSDRKHVNSLNSGTHRAHESLSVDGFPTSLLDQRLTSASGKAAVRKGPRWTDVSPLPATCDLVPKSVSPC